MNTNTKNIISNADMYEDMCVRNMQIKIAVIKKLPNGQWTVMSLKGKPLGKYKTKEQAVKRLRQIEYFKHHKKKKSSKKEDNSYSSVMRELNQNGDKDAARNFQIEFKRLFDEALLSGDNDTEEKVLDTAMESIAMQDINSLDLKKIGSAIDLGDPAAAGKYLSELIKFLLRRISPDRRQKSIENLRRKVYYLNEYDIARKRTPPSSSLGQAITLLKTILIEHSPEYIRNVLNSVVKYL